MISWVDHEKQNILVSIVVIHSLLGLCIIVIQGSHRLEKYLNLEGFLEKSLKIKYAL